MKNCKCLVMVFLCMILLIIGCLNGKKVIAASGYGSSGSEVREIQSKLKNWGYYDGEIDGIYGSGTFSAVKKFQEANGLKVDGIAGSQTLEALRSECVR